jgi:hypothetical protein
MRSEFLFKGKKVKWIKLEEEFCWAIKQVAELSFCGRQRYFFGGWKIRIQISRLYAYSFLTWANLRLVPDLPEPSYDLRRECLCRSKVRYRKNNSVCSAS